MHSEPGEAERETLVFDESELIQEGEFDYEEEEYTGPDKVQSIRNQEYYNTHKVTDQLYKDSKAGKKFYNLMDLVMDKSNIMLAYRNIKKNKGANTPGIDGFTMRDLGLRMLEELVITIQNLLTGVYIPQPVRRVYIPKPGSDKKRPLGIPCAEDKLIQQCFKQILEPIAEAKFYSHSHGFRPDRSAKDAIARCYALAQKHKYHFAVKVDIKSFFDNVNHNKLIKQLWRMGIRDKKFLSIIKAMLKAPIVAPNGGVITPDKGTPQGGVLSPLLANINLNDLDYWIASQYEFFPALTRRGKPYKNKGHYRALLKSRLKRMFIVRYADDFIIFTKTREEAEKIKIATEDYLNKWLGLETSEEKTEIINLRKKCVEFLGIKFKLHKKGDKFVIVSHLRDSAFKQIHSKLVKLIKGMEHPSQSKGLGDWINHYNSAVMGFHYYYQMATHVSEDMRKLAYSINKVLYNRLLQHEKDPKHGLLDKKSALFKRYGKSKQLRYFSDTAIAPIGYVQHVPPYCFNQDITRYTGKGRSLIHKALGVNIRIVLQLLKTPTYDRSIEYCDNRISKFCEQYGCCAITGVKLELFNIHCHHIKPVAREGPNDAYDNLIIVTEDIHRLIHATKASTIAKYLPLIRDKKQLAKLNKYRQEAGLEEIPELIK